MNDQLIFNLERRRAFNKEDFFVSSTNSLAIKILDNWKNNSDIGLIIVGPPACGKTHLCAVWSKETLARPYDISELTNIDLNNILQEKFIILEDVEKLELIADENRLLIEKNMNLDL